VLRHLLNLKVLPAIEPHAGWRGSIDEARDEIAGLLENSPSLRREIDGLIKKQIGTAAKLFADDLGQHRETADGVKLCLEQGGFTTEQVVGDWFPDSPR
jgi:Domain of unknown function DUF29